MKNKIIAAVGIALVTAASTILIAYFKDVENREEFVAQTQLYVAKAKKALKKLRKRR